MKARISLYISAVLLLAVVGLAAGCNKARSDAQIASEVQSKIYSDPAVQTKQVSVQSANGVVTLSGAVNSDAEKTAVVNDTLAVEGVKAVVNNLQVAPPPASAETASAPPPVESRPAPVSKPRASVVPRTRSLPSSAGESAAAPVAAAPAVYAAPAPTTPPPPAAPQKVTISSGTTLAVRLVDTIDSEVNQPGQTFHATLDSPLAVEGDVVVPAGYDVEGRIVDVKSAGHFAGRSELTLELVRISVGNKSYSLQTEQYYREGISRGKNTAAKVGTGAAIGAIIGGLAGGGKGAAIGATVGAGAGGGVQAATKGQQIRLPSETVLNFTLTAPLTVLPTKQGPNAGRQRLGDNQ